MLDKVKINMIQQEIMDLGGQLSQLLRGQVPLDVHYEIEQYFEHNEYGEAMELLQFTIHENQVELTREASRLSDLVLEKMREVAQLYE